jgi:methylase of polypeptide subunit release factors
LIGDNAGENCVYKPAEDTYLLLRAIDDLLEIIDPRDIKDIAELGSGSGLISQRILERLGHVRVIAVDISPYAIAETSRTLRSSPRALVVECDAGACISSVDLAVFNPPYLPPSELDYLIRDECDGWYLKALVDPESMYRMCIEASRMARKALVTVYSSISPIDLAECIRSRGFHIKSMLRLRSFFEEMIALVALRG